MISVLSYDESVLPQNLTAADINAVMIIRLPFRLRIGSLWRFPYDSNTEICFRNRVDIPDGGSQKTLAATSDYKSLFTDMMIVKRNLSLENNIIDQVAGSMRSRSHTPPVMTEDIFAVLRQLSEIANEFLVAYNIATDEFICGCALRRFSDMDINHHLCWNITLVLPASDRISEHKILDLFDKFPVIHPEQPSTMMFGDCHKLPETVLNRIRVAIDMKRSYIFCDFAFDAKTYMSSGQPVQGLLHAVIAFEGVHAAFLRIALTERLRTTCESVPERRVHDLVESLLKEAGLSAIHHLTPLLFMKPDERPSLDESDACQLGITIRNEVMHSLMKKGKYKLRNRTDIDITNAYKSVFVVYKKYLKALESRLKLLPVSETQSE